MALAYQNRASAYLEPGDRRSALADFEKAVSLDPTSVPAWYNLGVVHEDLGELGKAVENYGQAIILQRDNIDALTNRALVYSKLG